MPGPPNHYAAFGIELHHARHGTTRAWLVNTMSILPLLHRAQRHRSRVGGTSPRPAAISASRSASAWGGRTSM